MKYMLLIASDEAANGGPQSEESAAILPDYGKFWDEMSGRGVLTDGGRLRPTSDATTVRVRNGDVTTADGPFAETKEQIGGYYLVDCKDLDEAIEVASKIPHARLGSVEVRPIWEM